MTTVYPVSTQLTNYDAPEIDMEQIRRIAYYCVREVTRKWFITGALYMAHRDDLRQTAVTHVYEKLIVDQVPALFVFQNTKWALETYIWCSIYGRGDGHQWECSRHVYIDDGYDESYEGEADSPVAGVMRRVGRHHARQCGGYHNDRPVEEQVIAREEVNDWPDILAEFEREMVRILAALAGRQLYPKTILYRAQLIREVLDGETAGTLSDREGIARKRIMNRISDVRADIKTFLAQSPLLQGITRAKGEILVQWHDEVTAAMLNSGQRFMIILPYGAFTIGLKRDGRPRKGNAIQVQSGRRIDGKLVNRSCSLGPQGKATYERLLDATQKLQAKMVPVHEMADAANATLAVAS